jgi:hypothetical protein
MLIVTLFFKKFPDVSETTSIIAVLDSFYPENGGEKFISW